ncbi:MAG: glutamine synthetase, partial [Gammaproteobacteria bacterium]
MSQSLLERVAELREQGAARAKIGLADLDGVVRGKYISLDKLEGLARQPGGFCDCVFGWDMDDQLYDNAVFTGWHTAFPDAFYRLDVDTERWLDDEGIPYFIGEFLDRDAESPHPICPRTRLKSVLEQAASMGYGVKLGFEYEFFVFDETPHSLRDQGYRGLRPLSP